MICRVPGPSANRVSFDRLPPGMGTGDHAKALLPVLLKEGQLASNPWELPPAAVVAAGNDSIRGFYNELRQSATDPEEIQSLKVVFAGHSGAGKTRYAQSCNIYRVFPATCRFRTSLGLGCHASCKERARGRARTAL